MIIEGIFNLVYNFLDIILTPFQIIPDMPQHLVNQLNFFKTFIIDGLNMAFFILNPGTVRVAIPLAIAIMNMEHIWNGIMWVLKKLPFLGME